MPKHKAKVSQLKLPVTVEEAEARLYAKAFIARMCQPGFFDSGHGAFDPEGSHGWVRKLIRLEIEPHPLQAARIAEYARLGSIAADQVLRELIAEKVYRKEPDPIDPVLDGYNIHLLANPHAHHRHGKSQVDNLVQDIVIATLVIQLVERFSVHRTAWRQSACSIVADLLAEAGLHRGNEGAIEAISDRYNPIIMAGYCWPTADKNLRVLKDLRF